MFTLDQSVPPANRTSPPDHASCLVSDVMPTCSFAPVRYQCLYSCRQLTSDSLLSAALALNGSCLENNSKHDLWHEYHLDLCLLKSEFPVKTSFLLRGLPIEFADRRGRRKRIRTSTLLWRCNIQQLTDALPSLLQSARHQSLPPRCPALPQPASIRADQASRVVLRCDRATMQGIKLIRQHYIRRTMDLQTRQASTSQQDVKNAFAYCVQQVRCAADITIDTICVSALSNDDISAGPTTTTITFGYCSSSRYVPSLQRLAMVQTVLRRLEQVT